MVRDVARSAADCNGREGKEENKEEKEEYKERR